MKKLRDSLYNRGIHDIDLAAERGTHEIAVVPVRDPARGAAARGGRGGRVRGPGLAILQHLHTKSPCSRTYEQQPYNVLQYFTLRNNCLTSR
jgi:hypothetical protein